MTRPISALGTPGYLDLWGGPLIGAPGEIVHTQQQAVVHHMQGLQQSTVVLQLLHQLIIRARIQQQLEIDVQVLQAPALFFDLLTGLSEVSHLAPAKPRAETHNVAAGCSLNPSPLMITRHAS